MNNTDSENIQIGWVSGMPRSGTTWLSQIFASSPDVRLKFCPLFSYEFKNALNELSSAEEWKSLFKAVYQTRSEYLDQDYLRNEGLVPSFPEKNDNPHHLIIKSTRFHNLIPHLLQLDEEIRFIYLVRNPCATIYSWLTSPYEFPVDADPMTEWRTGSCRKKGPGEFWGFDDWKKITLQALELSNLYPGRFKIQRYEDLVCDTEKCTKDMFDFFGVSYDKQTDNFIELSQSRHDKNRRSVFKQQDFKNEWQVNLDSSIVSACIGELVGTELEQFLKED
ncbi:MAG: sulfotransferase [Sedimentisphaerales bacterium]